MRKERVETAEAQIESLFRYYMQEKLCTPEEFLAACANVINKERRGE